MRFTGNGQLDRVVGVPASRRLSLIGLSPVSRVNINFGKATTISRAIDFASAHRDECAPRCSWAMRAAHPRGSSKNFVDSLIAPPF